MVESSITLNLLLLRDDPFTREFCLNARILSLNLIFQVLFELPSQLMYLNQKILVVRKNITSYTGSTIVEDEWLQTLREDLVESIIAISPCDGQMSVA